MFLKAFRHFSICRALTGKTGSTFCGLFRERLLKFIRKKVVIFLIKGGGSMQKNEIYRLRAEKLGAEMEGICRLNGMPVFVPGLLPGEETDVRIGKTVCLRPDGNAARNSFSGSAGSRMSGLAPLRRMYLSAHTL